MCQFKVFGMRMVLKFKIWIDMGILLGNQAAGTGSHWFSAVYAITGFAIQSCESAAVFNCKTSSNLKPTLPTFSFAEVPSSPPILPFCGRKPNDDKITVSEAAWMCKKEYTFHNNISVPPELLQSRANICSRKSPFVCEALFREPSYFVKKTFNEFGCSNLSFQYWPLIMHCINSMLFGENWHFYELAREQDSLKAASKPKNVITMKKPRKYIISAKR